jgi:HK97 family phage prohead protease
MTGDILMATVEKLYNLSTKSSPVGNRIIRFIGSDESVDRDGDMISIDGWDISSYMKNPVVLFGHDSHALPIAKTISVTADKRARQLLFDIQFPTIEEISTNPATPSDHALKVDAIYNMAKAGILNTVSVGFRGIEYDATSTGRAYKRQELMEISIVPIPANPNAVAILRAAGATDTVIKGVTIMADKNVDLDGNPSISDIIRAIHKAINPTPGPNTIYKYVEDLYPVDFPSGRAIISEGSGKIFQRDYTYSKAGAVVSTDGKEVTQAYAAKGITKSYMGIKSNKRLSKESRSYLEERVAAMEKACGELRKFMADDDAEEGEPDDKGAGNPAVGEEIGTDVDEQQPEKDYVIDIVEKDSAESDKK